MYEKMNKLVRDNIPNIIEQKGDKPDFVILDSYDYYNELKKKLSEELTEFNESDDILELCDLVEVISAILDYRNINGKEFEEMRSKKTKPTASLRTKYFLTVFIECHNYISLKMIIKVTFSLTVLTRL